MAAAMEAMDPDFVRFTDNFFQQFGDGGKIQRMVLNLESKLSSDKVSVMCLFWLLWMNIGSENYRPFIEVKISDIAEIYFSRHPKIPNIAELELNHQILIIRCGWGDIRYDYFEAIVRSVLSAVSEKKSRVLFLVGDKSYLWQSWDRIFTDHNYTEAKFFYAQTITGEAGEQQPSGDPAAKPTLGKASNYKADC